MYISFIFRSRQYSRKSKICLYAFCKTKDRCVLCRITYNCKYFLFQVIQCYFRVWSSIFLVLSKIWFIIKINKYWMYILVGLKIDVDNIFCNLIMRVQMIRPIDNKIVQEFFFLSQLNFFSRKLSPPWNSCLQKSWKFVAKNDCCFTEV